MDLETGFIADLDRKNVKEHLGGRRDQVPNLPEWSTIPILDRPPECCHFVQGLARCQTEQRLAQIWLAGGKPLKKVNVRRGQYLLGEIAIDDSLDEAGQGTRRIWERRGKVPHREGKPLPPLDQIDLAPTGGPLFKQVEQRLLSLDLFPGKP